MYHERQHLMHCAMHALNNLFQEPWADRQLMERLALELYDREATLRSESGMRRMLVNPFKSAVPLVGDYDISVVIEALKLRECRVTLHVIFNPRDPSAFELALAQADWDSASVRGVIVNFVAQNLLWGTWVTHHFYAIVKGPERLCDAVGREGGYGSASEEGEGSEGSEGQGRGVRGAQAAEDGGTGGRSGGRRKRKGVRNGNTDGERARWLGRLGPPNFCTGKRGPRRGSSSSSSSSGGGGGGGSSCDETFTEYGHGNRHGEEGKTRSGDEGSSGSSSDSGGGGEGAAPGGRVWYSLDSRIPQPKRLGGTRGLIAHLAWEVREHHGHVFVVEDGVEGETDANADET